LFARLRKRADKKIFTKSRGVCFVGKEIYFTGVVPRRLKIQRRLQSGKIFAAEKGGGF
jgi:hypothetical protein